MSLLIRWKVRRTRHELLKLKDQLELAQKAHTLLEEKYRILMQEAQHIRSTLGLRSIYRAALSVQANDVIEIEWTTIRGVTIPRLASKIRKRTPLERGYGLTSTNHLLDKAAETFEDAVQSLVHVAELSNILRILEKEIKKTGIRVSALEKVLIPSLKKEIKIIKSKLEEKEREAHIIVKWGKETQSEIV